MKRSHTDISFAILYMNIQYFKRYICLCFQPTEMCKKIFYQIQPTHFFVHILNTNVEGLFYVFIRNILLRLSDRSRLCVFFLILRFHQKAHTQIFASVTSLCSPLFRLCSKSKEVDAHNLDLNVITMFSFCY